MGFGLSGDDDRTKMVGGDVTIAWMDHKSGINNNVFDIVVILRWKYYLKTLILHSRFLLYIIHRSRLCGRLLP